MHVPMDVVNSARRQGQCVGGREQLAGSALADPVATSAGVAAETALVTIPTPPAATSGTPTSQSASSGTRGGLLAFTGLNGLSFLFVGALLLAAGEVALLLGRRKRTTQPQAHHVAKSPSLTREGSRLLDKNSTQAERREVGSGGST
jgi:hypothetical protein